MDTLTIGFVAIVAFLVLALLGLPLAFSFITVGFAGLVMLRGAVPAMALLGETPYASIASYLLAAVPLFVLMGQFAFYSGISRDLFNAAHKWMSRLPGGLAQATMLACTAFAACTGSSVASAATMSAVAYPEMERLNYSPRLATGTIAAGGALGILIPPSTIFIILGIITEQSIGTLFIAGFLPGLMLAGLFIILIFVMSRLNPSLGPPGEPSTWKEKFTSLTGIWGMLVLFILVLGGLYFGIFAPSEAGTVGAFGAFILALTKRTPRNSLLKALVETAQTTAYILFILIGATVFNTFLALGGVSSAISNWILSFSIPPMLTVIVILIVYIPLGMFIDPLGAILLTVPVFYPIVTGLGFDPIWFLVLVCVMTELGLITPPVAINVYVVQGVTKVPMEEVFRGIVPFALVFLVGIALLVAFPQISLFLPGTMK
ncbi:MAG TPA: TRAP transporter large permease [Dehalococcoidales bacterium]|nr:MAG: C4-dicarboxylate ABC transporter permease [Chloroflexi bacterium RBG_16_60_22]HJX12426.1 TRAP transporter large permease [Dehalococcoidales bacterium]